MTDNTTMRIVALRAFHRACWRHDARGWHGARVGSTVREWAARCAQVSLFNNGNCMQAPRRFMTDNTTMRIVALRAF